MYNLLVLLLVSPIFLTNCSRSTEPLPIQTSLPATQTVEIATLVLQNVAETVEAAGTVKSAHPTVLSAKVTDTVVAVHIQVGDRIYAGQLLVTLDDREFQTQLQKAKAGRRDVDHALAEADQAILAAEKSLAAAAVQQGLAQATLTRYAALFERGSVAPQEYDGVAAQQKIAAATLEQAAASKAALLEKRQQVLAKREQADADLAQAQVLLSYTAIIAPRAGVITARMAEVGAMAIPGSPLLMLDSEDYVLEATLRESDSTKVQVGQESTVTIDALQQQLSGTIREILFTSSSASRTLTLKISLPSTPSLRSGLYGKSQFVVGQRPSLLVPASALVERGQLQRVFVVDERNRANMRLVSTGKTVKDKIELLAGAEAGERIVVRGAETLTDGAVVTEERAQ